jgi:hypothetical protein
MIGVHSNSNQLRSGSRVGPCILPFQWNSGRLVRKRFGIEPDVARCEAIFHRAVSTLGIRAGELEVTDNGPSLAEYPAAERTGGCR